MDWTSNLAYDDENGQTTVVGRPAFIMEMYAKPWTLYDRTDALLDLLLPRLGSDVYFIGGNKRTYTRLMPKSERRVRAQLANPASVGAMISLKTAPDFIATGHSCEISIAQHNRIGNDVVVACLPLTDGADAPRGARELFRHILDAFNFWGAIAGFGYDIVWGREYEQVAMPLNFRVARRYHGVLVRDRILSRNLGRATPSGEFHGRLPSVAWQTYLGPELLSDIGDFPTPPSQIVTHTRTRTGTLLQAGPVPNCIDVNRSLGDAEPFQVVHRLISPILCKQWGPSVSLLDVDHSTAEMWLRRFE